MKRTPTGPVRADKGEPARKPQETRSGTETRNLANPFPGIQLLFIFGGLKKENQIKPTSMSAYKKGKIFFVVLHFLLFPNEDFFFKCIHSSVSVISNYSNTKGKVRLLNGLCDENILVKTDKMHTIETEKKKK